MSKRATKIQIFSVLMVISLLITPAFSFAYEYGNYPTEGFSSGNYPSEGYDNSNYSGSYSAENYYSGYTGDSSYVNGNYPTEGYSGGNYPTESYSSANYPTEGYAAASYPTQGYSIADYSTQGFSAANYPSDSYASANYPTEGYAAANYATQGYTAANYPTESYSSANYPTEGYTAANYPTQGYVSANYPTEGYTAANYPTQGYSAANYPTEGYSAANYPTQGYNAANYPTQGYTAANYPTEGFSAANYPTQGYNAANYPTEGYNAANYPTQGYNAANYSSNYPTLAANQYLNQISEQTYPSSYETVTTYTECVVCQSSNYSFNYGNSFGYGSAGYGSYYNPVYSVGRTYPSYSHNPNFIYPSNPSYPSYPTYPSNPSNPNQVLGYNDTPGLSSVYLSDVPYTGFNDAMEMILFIISLAYWSGGIAFVAIKKKIAAALITLPITLPKIPAIQTVQAAIQNSSLYHSFSAEIANDVSDLQSIHEFARNNKILLSNSAAQKVLKMKRLNNLNEFELLSQFIGSDWTCIGDSEIQNHLAFAL